MAPDQSDRREFNGHIYFFHSFDIGEDINLDKVKNQHLVMRKPLAYSRYFKNYHIPLAIELPHPHESSHCESAKLHNFGVITLRYKIPFISSIEELKQSLSTLEDEYHDQSVSDAGAIFKRIKTAIKQPRFFH